MQGYLSYIMQDLCFIEEMFLRQKSRIQWIIEGDRNTSFFHNVVKDGNRLTTYEDIAIEAVSFYTNLLGSSDSSYTGGSVEEIRVLLSYQPIDS